MGSFLLVLILVFVLLGLFITIELVYVLWYRKKFRQQSTASDDIERSVVSSVFSSNNNNEPYALGTPPPSKELALYYLYWKNETLPPFGNTNNESTVFAPAFAVPVPRPPSPPLFCMPPPLPHPLPPPPPPPVVEDDDDDDDDDDDNEDGKLAFRERLRSRLLQSKRLESSPVIKEKEEEEDATQFSSATASPFYTTPTSSPIRPTSDGRVGEELMILQKFLR